MTQGDTLAGEVAFKLYDTFGFPYDLTEDALRAQGLAVDRTGFDAAMAEQKRAARAAWKGSGERASDDIWFDIAEAEGSTEFTGYAGTEGEGVVVALVKDGARVDQAGEGDSVIILTNQTPFYGESGGQMGDAGAIRGEQGFEAEVADTSKPLGRLHAHHAIVKAGAVKVGDPVKLQVDTDRRGRIKANHSATHLIHAALRNRLGGHVTQKGSLVAADRFRFDFSHPKALTPEDIEAVEGEVNFHIRQNQPVTTRLMSHADAIEAGAMALFGEKYGDEVRVLTMGTSPLPSTGEGARASAGAGEGLKPYSVELCGGTHVTALGDIQLFKIVSESAVSSGVRRIEALTGEAARRYLLDREQALRSAAATLKAAPDEVPARVAALIEERRRLERELAEAKKALALGGRYGEGGRRPRASRRYRLHRPGTRRHRPQAAARPGRRSQAARRLRGRRVDRAQRRPRQRRRRRHRRPGLPLQCRRPRPHRRCRARRPGRRRPSRHGPGRRPDGSKAEEALLAIRSALQTEPVTAG
jgi:alanyl-tRNA synthetase